MSYEKTVERAATIEYHHAWLDWRGAGIMAAVLVVIIAALAAAILNGNDKAWGTLIVCVIGLVLIGVALLVDLYEYRKMSGCFARIRMSASLIQAQQAKKEGHVH